MAVLNLDFHGVAGAVSCEAPGVLEELRRDFGYFEGQGGAPSFRLSLRLGPPPRAALPSSLALHRSAHFTAYDRGTTRIVDHNGKALSTLDFRTESAEIFSEDAALLRELGYLLISSRAGYLLDLKGFHRIHALGLACAGKGALVLLPSGGGKTRLCLEALRSGKASLLSEDTPLLGPDGRLWPFPLRLGLLPEEDASGIAPQFRRVMERSRHGRKILVDLPFFADALSGPVKPGLIVVGKRRAQERPRARRAAPLAAAGTLLSSMVLGLGLPQLTEYMLRGDLAGLATLARIALRRAAAMAKLVRSCPAAELELGTDGPANLEALLGLMGRAK